MDIYQGTALLLFRDPPEALLTFEPWLFLQEVMLKEMLRENSCKAQAVVEHCPDLLLTFGFLTLQVKAWLQVLLRERSQLWQGCLGVGEEKQLCSERCRVF